MINVENITKSFGAQTLFKNATFLISEQARIGILGPNGAGKSTLFKILMEEESLDGGEIRKPSKTTLALLRQEWIPKDDHSVLDACLNIHKTWITARDNLLALGHDDPAYHDNENVFYALGGYAKEHEAKILLSGLGFKDHEFNLPCKSFSGGWRMRVQLAGLLLMEPSLLLLDEPTNHLDVESVVWFENFLLKYPHAYMVISHDRRLIEKLSTSILDFTPPNLTLWPYTLKKFEEQKKMRMDQIASASLNKQKEIDHLEDFVRRFGAKASKARQAQSKAKMMEKAQEELESIKENMPLIAKRDSSFRLEPKSRVPKVLVEMNHVVFGYSPQKPLFTLEESLIEGGKKIGIIGVNGVGKSTYLKTSAGEIKPLSGKISLNVNTSIGYFGQHRIEELPLEWGAYDYLFSEAQSVGQTKVRAVAASLGLGELDLEKKIGFMSGGEKARVSLTKIILDRPNLLLLDEPTNHLDMEACDSLVEGLKNYAGTVLVVSHNRDFLDALCDLILEVEPKVAHLHHGNYSEWLDRKQKQAQVTATQSSANQANPNNAPKPSGGKKTKEQKRLEALERQKKYEANKGNPSGNDIDSKLKTLNAQLKEIDTYLIDPQNIKSPDYVKKLKERSTLSHQLETLEEAYLKSLD